MENNEPITTDNQVRPPLRTRATLKPHAGQTGNPYPREVCESIIQRYIEGLPLGDDVCNFLRASHDFPSMPTCRRYIQQYNNFGHIVPFCASGNARAKRELRGEVLLRFALFRCVRPKATIDECWAYLYNLDPDVEPYSPSQIFRAEKLLGLSKKAASTTADLAYLPINIQRRENYWNF